jgi:hypothetical protein
MRSVLSYPVATLALLALAGAAAPVSAQADFSGIWQPRFHEDQVDRLPGPELRDYTGLPLNDSARQFADAWDPSRLTLIEEQCRVHTAQYILWGPMNVRIFPEKDPLTQQLLAWTMYISTFEQTRTIWMDGRPHPGPNHPHTWMGFSTGRYQGDMLVVETTHMKQGWHRRNGVLQSDRATMTEYFVRNGDVLTIVRVIVDPDYLTEPLVRSHEIALSARELPQQNWLWVCQPVVEIAGRPEGEVPHYMPGEHPFADEFARRHNLPGEAVRGGAETTLPEYQETLRRLLSEAAGQAGSQARGR